MFFADRVDPWRVWQSKKQRPTSTGDNKNTPTKTFGEKLLEAVDEVIAAEKGPTNEQQ